jgi:WD40 repeat protein
MSVERATVLEQLRRTVSLSEGEFALILARCNVVEIRDRLIADLRSHLGEALYLWIAIRETGAVNLVNVLDEALPGTRIACIVGLENSPYLNDILAIANNAREEFRRRFNFPVVVWVTDEVEAQLRRRAPDLASWAAPPFDFALDRLELHTILKQETADVLDWALSQQGRRGVGQELQWAWQTWQQLGEATPPELEAALALVFGIEAGHDDAAKQHFEHCLSLIETGHFPAAAHYRLGLWWLLRGKRNRAEFLTCCERAREQLQQTWDIEKSPHVALALGEVLLALASPEEGDSAQWQSVATFATQLSILPEWAAGLQAEVALARQDWKTAKSEAERALQVNNHEGLYLLALGRSLVGLEQVREAIAHLKQAKIVVSKEVDPDIHIRILQALHKAYTAVGRYREAFMVKCDLAAVETEYGFRAFIGAGRLRPQRRLGVIGEADSEEIVASGRQTDIDALLERVKRNDCRLTIIYGPSGVGKSSLIQSGLVPALRKLIHQSRSVLPVVVEHYENWRGELAQKLRVSRFSSSSFLKTELQSPSELENFESGNSAATVDNLRAQLHENDRCNLITVLFFDQFEEFFFKHTDVPGQQQFYDFLRECLDVPYVWVMLSLREDYVHYLLECDRLTDLSLINNDILNKNVRYYLGNFDQVRAKAVLQELTEKSPYQLELALVDRLVGDLAAELGEVRPIEMQVVGAQMLHEDKKITTLEAYEKLGTEPKRVLVGRWLTQVLADCGKKNEELAQRVLFALTQEPEKRPKKTKVELQREVRLQASALQLEERDFAVEGDLDFVLIVLIGSGLVFEIPSVPEANYQLIHDYLVSPIRQQFGVKLSQQLEEERQKRKEADEKVLKRNRWLLQGSATAAFILAILVIASLMFAVLARQNEQEALRQARIAEQQKALADTKRQDALEQEKIAKSEKKNALEQRKLANINATSALRRQNEANQQRKLAEQRRIEADWERNKAEEASKAERTQRERAEEQTKIARYAEVQAKDLTEKNKLKALNTQAVADSLYLKGLMDADVFNLEEQVSALEKAKVWQSKLTDLHGDNLIKLLATLNLAGDIPREKSRFEDTRESITQVAFAPNGKSILAGSMDKTAKLWSVDGKLLHTFSGHQGGVSSIAFSPDGRFILTGSWDKTAKLWSINGNLLHTFSNRRDYISSVAFAPDSKRILTGNGDGSAKLWSVDGQLLHTFPGLYLSFGITTEVAFSPDSRYVLATASDGKVRLWSIDGQLLHTFVGHKARVISVAFASDGKRILTGSGDKTAKLWSIDGQLLHTFSGHQDDVSSVAFAPDGKSILTGGDKMAKLWSTDGQLLHTFSGYASTVASVAFAPDGKSILTGGDKTAKLWSINRQLLHTFPSGSGGVTSVAFAPDGKHIFIGGGNYNAKLWSLNGQLLHTFSGHKSYIYSVAFAPDGKHILTGSRDKTAKLWSIDGQLLHTFSGHKSYIYSVAFAPDGKHILTGSRDKTAKLWSIDGQLLHTFSGHKSYIYSVAFAPNGKYILTGSVDKTAKLWSLDGQLLHTFSGHQSLINSVVFAPDGKHIFTGGYKTAKLWSLDGQLLHTFSGHQSSINSVVFAPDGKHIFTGSADKTAKLWSTNGQLLHTFSGHQDDVSSVAFAPNGKSVLTGSADKTAKLWSTNGQLLHTFSGHQDKVRSVAFAPDGKSILTGSTDKTARLWDLHLDHILSAMCDHLHDFSVGIQDPSLSEESRQLRQRAHNACADIPPLQKSTLASTSKQKKAL